MRKGIDGGGEILFRFVPDQPRQIFQRVAQRHVGVIGICLFQVDGLLGRFNRLLQMLFFDLRIGFEIRHFQMRHAHVQQVHRALFVVGLRFLHRLGRHRQRLIQIGQAGLPRRFLARAIDQRVPLQRERGRQIRIDFARLRGIGQGRVDVRRRLRNPGHAAGRVILGHLRISRNGLGQQLFQFDLLVGKRPRGPLIMADEIGGRRVQLVQIGRRRFCRRLRVGQGQCRLRNFLE